LQQFGILSLLLEVGKRAQLNINKRGAGVGVTERVGGKHGISFSVRGGRKGQVLRKYEITVVHGKTPLTKRRNRLGKEVGGGGTASDSLLDRWGQGTTGRGGRRTFIW